MAVKAKIHNFFNVLNPKGSAHRPGYWKTPTQNATYSPYTPRANKSINEANPSSVISWMRAARSFFCSPFERLFKRISWRPF